MLCYLRSHVPWESWKRLFSWSQDIQLRPPSSQERKEKALCLYTSLLNCCLRTTGELRQKLAFLDKLVLPSDSCTDSPAYPCHGNVQQLCLRSDATFSVLLLEMPALCRMTFFSRLQSSTVTVIQEKKEEGAAQTNSKTVLNMQIHTFPKKPLQSLSLLPSPSGTTGRVLRQRGNRNSTLWQWKYSFSKLKGVLTLTMSLKAFSALFCV